MGPIASFGQQKPPVGSISNFCFGTWFCQVTWWFDRYHAGDYDTMTLETHYSSAVFTGMMVTIPGICAFYQVSEVL